MSRIVSGVLAGLLAMCAVLVFGQGPLWKMCAALSALSAVAFLLHGGWLIPCTIIGVIVGYFTDPVVKGGTLDAQMQETAAHILGGAIAGLVVGFLAEGRGR